MAKNQEDLALVIENLGVQLHKRYGFLGLKNTVHWALQDVSFDLMKGEVLGVMGRNGSGKSTLLRTLAGIINPDRGRIERFGHSVCLLSLAVGFMHELTGRQNAVLSGMLMGRSHGAMQALLPEILEFSEIGRWFEVPVSTYSSGMRQRLAFSIAINVQTDVLLLDEIMSVGDEGFRAKSRLALMEVIKSGRTVVLVSNNSTSIAEYCDRAVWIEGGRTMLQAKSNIVRGAYLRFFDEVHGLSGQLPSDDRIQEIIEEAKSDLEDEDPNDRNIVIGLPD